MNPWFYLGLYLFVGVSIHVLQLERECEEQGWPPLSSPAGDQPEGVPASAKQWWGWCKLHFYPSFRLGWMMGFWPLAMIQTMLTRWRCGTRGAPERMRSTSGTNGQGQEANDPFTQD